MTKATQDSEATIDELLEQRAQYEEWLAKLDASGDKAPPAVRQRVRGDYEARLQSVMEQLRNRGAAVSEELERHHATQAELDRERRAAEEALAEAEVRYAVGEYTEEEWRRLSEESRREIEQLRNKLRAVGAEITRLTQVQGVIASPRSSTAPAAPPQRAAPRPEVVEQAPLVIQSVAEPVEEPQQARSRFAPKPAPQPEPSAAPVDELAFLKSVSDEEPMSSRRPSNPGMAAPSTSGMVAPSIGRAQEPAVQTVPTVSKAGVAKTLKCGECGTLNRPTEWYCERCGAELAGV